MRFPSASDDRSSASTPSPRTFSTDPHPTWKPIPIAARFAVVRKRSSTAMVLALAGALIGLVLAVGDPPTPVCPNDENYGMCQAKHVYGVQLAEVAGGALAGGFLGLLFASMTSGAGPARRDRRRAGRQADASPTDRRPGPVERGTTPTWGMCSRPSTHRYDPSHASRAAPPSPPAGGEPPR